MTLPMICAGALVCALAWSAPPDFSFRFDASSRRPPIWGGGPKAGQPEAKYLAEFLPALFERTAEFETLDLQGGTLHWIFTGERGGVTVQVTDREIRLLQRYYDSFGLHENPKPRPRHPEKITAQSAALRSGPLRSLTVRFDHKLQVAVLANEVEVLRQDCLLDVRRHQLAYLGEQGADVNVRGLVRAETPEEVSVRVDPSARRQTMLGFGGIATPTAYAQLSAEGKRRWWQLLAEYNLLLQREYPNGVRLNPAMDNFDRLKDATPHYYGENFPNGEISDFGYLKTLRHLGGKILFEFWGLPPWAAHNSVDGRGETHTRVTDMESYTRAMARYCQLAKERTGAPPEIVGVQNEVRQPPEVFQQMTIALRKALDDAGFQQVKIHLRDAAQLEPGIRDTRAFRASAEAWRRIDYSASHMYDYQRVFHHPDAYDGLLREWHELTGDKPFLSTEISVNDSNFQVDSYRLALSMGQLYHKNLTLSNAVALLYCWTLLNVEQPSYGWTRTLFVPDPKHGHVPVASSYQARVFGAYSRRVREGMTRLEALTRDPDLLVTAFEGRGGARTMVVLNRSARPKLVTLEWPNTAFRYVETADPYQENSVQPARPGKILVEGGAVVTLTNVELGRTRAGSSAAL